VSRIRSVNTPGLREFRLVDYLRGENLFSGMRLDETDDQVIYHFGNPAREDVEPACMGIYQARHKLAGDSLNLADAHISVPALLLAYVYDAGHRPAGAMYTAFCLSLRTHELLRVSLLPHGGVLYLTVFTKTNTKNPRQITTEDLIVYRE